MVQKSRRPSFVRRENGPSVACSEGNKYGAVTPARGGASYLVPPQTQELRRSLGEASGAGETDGGGDSSTSTKRESPRRGSPSQSGFFTGTPTVARRRSTSGSTRWLP